MEDEKRTYLSETVGLPLKMVLVHSEDDSAEKDSGTPAGPRKPKDQREKEAAVLRLIQHLHKKA